MYVKEEATGTIVIDKSEFICYLKRCKSEQEFKDYLAQIHKKHYEARHISSAFICHDIKRSNDDGEPSGTAGRPILSVLEKNGLDETAALVVRHYGGIKLGAGGLMRAYGEATVKALENAILAEDVIYPVYELAVSYELDNKLSYYIENNTLLLNKEYGVEVVYTFGLDDKNKLEKIKEFTKGLCPTYIRDEVVVKVL